MIDRCNSIGGRRFLSSLKSEKVRLLDIFCLFVSSKTDQKLADESMLPATDETNRFLLLVHKAMVNIYTNLHNSAKRSPNFLDRLVECGVRRICSKALTD